MQFRISARSVYEGQDQLVRPVSALASSGQELVVAEARLVAGCSALRFLKLLPGASDEAATSTLAVVTMLALILGDGIPFIPDGREFRDERNFGRMIGFAPQTLTMIHRAHLFGYNSAPPGADVIDATGPIPSAEFVLKLIRGGLVDIPILLLRPIRDFLETIAREGVPIHDRPPSSRWLN